MTESIMRRVLQCTQVAVASTMLAVVTGCSKPPEERSEALSKTPVSAAPAARQELVRGNLSEPHSLDPQIGYGTEMFILRDLHEGLVESAPDGSTLPAVAERWESDNNRVYRFFLRKNAKWSNGDPITAEDFVFSWRRLVSPHTGSHYSWYLEAAGVKNAGAITQGKKPPESLGVEALDDYTLQVTLDRPQSYFVEMLVHACTYPLHPPTVKHHGSDWARLDTHIGNGPFRLNNWVVNEQIDLTRNPMYWNAEAVNLEKVTYLAIADSQAEVARYLAGDLDITYQISEAGIKQLKKTNPDEIHIAPMLGTRYVSYNTKLPPLDDVRLRKALSFSIDRQLIVEKVTKLGENPSYTLTPLDTTGIEDPQLEWANWSQLEREQEARKLYAQAGYSSNHPLKLRLLHASGGKKLTVAIAAMWKRVLGAEIALESNEFRIYLQKLEKGDFQAASAPWIGDYFEPSSMLNLMRGDAGTNGSGFANANYDAILLQSASESDPAVRARLYAEAERILSNETPISPLYQFTNARLVKPYVQGYSNHPMMLLPSKNLWISEH